MKEIIGAICTVVGALFILTLILMFPTYWLWNWLMPMIFGLTRITVWQALGLNLLAGILFKSTSNSKK